MSRHHSSNKVVSNLKDSLIVLQEELENSFYENECENFNENDMEMFDQNNLDLNFKLTQNFVEIQQYYMRLYLKLKYKYLIAEYKCDEIFQEINNIIKVNNSHKKDLLKKQSLNTVMIKQQLK